MICDYSYIPIRLQNINNILNIYFNRGHVIYLRIIYTYTKMRVCIRLQGKLIYLIYLKKEDIGTMYK